MCQNLSFDRLYEVSNELTELLRDRTGEQPGIPEAMENTVREMMSEKIAQLITEMNRLTGTNQEGED